MAPQQAGPTRPPHHFLGHGRALLDALYQMQGYQFAPNVLPQVEAAPGQFTNYEPWHQGASNVTDVMPELAIQVPNTTQYSPISSASNSPVPSDEDAKTTGPVNFQGTNIPLQTKLTLEYEQCSISQTTPTIVLKTAMAIPPTKRK